MTALPSMNGPLVVLAAGGTGGHMFPAEALARALIARGIRTALVTDQRGQAFGEALPSVEVYRIRASRLPRYAIDRIKAFIEMGLGGLEARRLLRRLKPDAVVGFGGYPSIPTIFAAALAKIPIVLHEQNALLGRANRRLASRAKVIATSFETVAHVPAGVATALTGNPVRPAILPVRELPYRTPGSGEALSILVTGGSQGARVFSEIVPAAMALLPADLKARIKIVQQSRPEDLAAAQADFAAAGVAAELSTFFNDMPARIAASHLVICRSGASTVAELGVAGRPAILVPYPFATDDHQTNNAEAFAQGGGGWVISQRILTPQLLADRIAAVVARPETLARAAEAARAQGRPDAAERFADLVIEKIGGHGTVPPAKSSVRDVAA
jgi:UDP-N-acetylglucosamine--N-acetylmuramyl-(pentapeptide) pyrophosphoryl-undecaprenol N-acetylglucosamine transferase